MFLKKFLKITTIAIASLGVLATGVLASFAALGNNNNINLFSDQTRTYSCEYYVDDVLVHSEIKKRGEPIEYNEIPTKHSDVDGTFYVFSGWDYNNDGIADVPQLKAYMNFKAKALFTRFNMPNIDYAKLLQILQDLNIDLEAFLNFLGLDWEDIAKLLKDPVIKFTTDQEGLVYFRTESFGDYDSRMSRWNDSDYYPLSNISNGSVNPLLYAGSKVQQQNYYPIANFDIEYVKEGKKYPVPAVEVSNNEQVSSDAYSLVNPTNNMYKTQGLGFLPATKFIMDMAGLIPFPEAVRNDEIVYRQYARDHYCNIDDMYKNFFLDLTAAAEINTSNLGSVVDGINKFYATQGYKFNLLMKNYPRNEDNILYFMSTAKEGTGRQFASATTMWLRALGYPARYTQGYTTYAQGTGEEEIVNAVQAHAWCEVYVDNLGWMMIDGALSGELDTIKDTPFNPFFNEDDDVDLDQYDHERELIRIEKNEATKTHYIVGQAINENDVFVNAYYSDGYEDIVKPTYFVSPDMSTWGYKTVLCVYVEHSITKTCKYEIFVEPAKVESMSAMLIRQGKIYTDEPDLTPFDFYFNGTYTDGIDREIDSGQVVVLSISPAQNIEGLHVISFSFTEFYPDEDSRTVTCSCEYESFRRPAPISIAPIYEQNEYWQYEEYRPLEFIIEFDDGSTKYVNSDDPGLVLDNYPDMSVPGDKSVYYEYTCDGGSIGYEHIFHVTEIYCVSIDVSLSKSIYIIGVDDVNEEIRSNLSISATYNNGEVRTIDPNSDAVDVPYVDMTTPHDEDLNITYTETLYSGELNKVGDFVLLSIVKAELESIEIASLPYATTIYTNDEIYIDGLILLAHFSYGEDKYIYFDDPGISVDPVDTSTPGQKEVIVHYTHNEITKDVSYTINVLGLDHIEIDWEGSNVKDTYYKHRESSRDYYIVGTAFLDDGTDVLQPIPIKQDDVYMNVYETFDEATHVGTIHVEYNFHGITKTDEYNYDYIDLEIVDMTLNVESIKTEFLQGDIFTCDGLIAHVTYNDGVEEDVFYGQPGFVVSDDGSTLNEVGEKVITVTYTPFEDVSFETTFTINVKRIVGLKIDFEGARTRYDECTIGDWFDYEYNTLNKKYPAQIEFEDGETKDVTEYVDYSLSFVSFGEAGVSDSIYSIIGTYVFNNITFSDSLTVYATTYKYEVNYDNKGETVYYNDQFYAENLSGVLIGSDGSSIYTEDVSYNPKVEVGNNSVTFSSSFSFDIPDESTLQEFTDVSNVYVKKLESLDIFYDGKTSASFLRGDTFDWSKVTYVANFSDGTTMPVEISCTIPALNVVGSFNLQASLTLGTVTVYGNLPYEVLEPIAISISPNIDEVQTQFSRYETFNSDRLTITVTYENGFSEIVTNNFEVDSESFDPNNVGQYPIYISYTHTSHQGEENLDCSYQTTVIERKLISIELVMSKTEFFEGESITSDDYKVIGHYNFGESREQTIEEYTIDIPTFDEFGTYTITVSSFVNPELTVTKEVTYSRIVPTYLELNSSSAKTKFLVDSQFSYDGLFGYGHYNNGDTDYVPNEELIATAPDMSTTGNKEVTVKAFVGGTLLESSYTITVYDREPTITLKSYTGKTQINRGSANYSPTEGQLEFIYDYSGIEKETIYVSSNEYTYEVISGEIDTSTVGNTWTIRYSARGKSIDVVFVVTITPEKYIDFITSGSIRTTFAVGEDIYSTKQLGYIVVYYMDGTNRQSYNYYINNLNTSTPTEAGKSRMMTITYYEKTPSGGTEYETITINYTVA